MEMNYVNNLIFLRKVGSSTFITFAQLEGPSITFKIIRTVSSHNLKFYGNCLNGSRPLMIFNNF